MSAPSLAAIVACGRNMVIGNDNGMPWGKIRRDMARFVRLTKGHPVVMGRKTFESIGAPLGERTNIVVTHNPDRYRGLERREPNLLLRDTLDGALDLARSLDTGIAFIIGGGEIYRQAMGQIDAIHMTRIAGDFEGDVYFPKIDPQVWEVAGRHAEDGDPSGWKLEFIDWVRTAPVAAGGL